MKSILRKIVGDLNQPDGKSSSSANHNENDQNTTLPAPDLDNVSTGIRTVHKNTAGAIYETTHSTDGFEIMDSMDVIPNQYILAIPMDSTSSQTTTTLSSFQGVLSSSLHSQSPRVGGTGRALLPLAQPASPTVTTLHHPYHTVRQTASMIDGAYHLGDIIEEQFMDHDDVGCIESRKNNHHLTVMESSHEKDMQSDWNDHYTMISMQDIGKDHMEMSLFDQPFDTRRHHKDNDSSPSWRKRRYDDHQETYRNNHKQNNDIEQLSSYNNHHPSSYHSNTLKPQRHHGQAMQPRWFLWCLQFILIMAISIGILCHFNLIDPSSSLSSLLLPVSTSHGFDPLRGQQQPGYDSQWEANRLITPDLQSGVDGDSNHPWREPTQDSFPHSQTRIMDKNIQPNGQHQHHDRARPVKIGDYKIGRRFVLPPSQQLTASTNHDRNHPVQLHHLGWMAMLKINVASFTNDYWYLVIASILLCFLTIFSISPAIVISSR